jgi:8-oxo-dGTP pyrophosphatase MutT (NUDIX family)
MEPKKIGAGILMIDAQTGDVLLGRRGFQSQSPNTWAPFGGTFEGRDGHPKITAQREFEEESGITEPYQISKKPFHISNDNHLQFYTYLGIIIKKFPVSIGSESLGYGWFPLSGLPHNLLSGFEKLLGEKKTELEGIIEKAVKGEDVGLAELYENVDI